MSPVSPTSPAASVHLVVLIHGLWGSPDHVGYLANSLKNAGHLSATDSQLSILIPASIQWTNTYDGIDYCAEHVAQEIDQRVQELRLDSKTITKFSIVGYSLGGLIARFLIGLLHSRQPSFFDQIEPISFNTFASPWIGMPRYKGILSSTIHFFGSRLLSRTGNQLYLTDKYHRLPNSKSPETNGNAQNQKNSSKKKYPLLSLLAHPDTNFYKALLNFKVVNVYANAINDRTVPFVTGAIEKFDLFKISKELSRKSKLANNQSDLTELEILQLGGLEVKFNPQCPCLIENVESIGTGAHSDTLENMIGKQETGMKGARLERWSGRIPKLPFFMKPSTYPFRNPLNYLAAGLSPMIAPIFLVYILSSFCYQSYQSRQRIKRHHAGDLEHHSARLRRVGLLHELEQDLIEDIAGMGTQTSFERNLLSPEAEPVRRSGSAPAPSDHAHEAEECQLLPDAVQHSSAPSAAFPPLDPPHRPALPAKGTRYLAPQSLPDAEPLGHDLGLSAVQITMLEDLNRLPNLSKFFAFFDGIPNAHGAIIYRAEGLSDRRGKKVVQHWAERLIL